MSQCLPSFPKQGASKRTPLEIWDNILRIAVESPLDCEKKSIVPYTDTSDDCQYTCRYRLSEVTRHRLQTVCSLWNEILSHLQDRIVVFFPFYYWPHIHDWSRVHHIIFTESVSLICSICKAKFTAEQGIRYFENGEKLEGDQSEEDQSEEELEWPGWGYSEIMALTESCLDLVNMDMVETFFSSSQLFNEIEYPTKRVRKLSGVFVRPLASISSEFENLREVTFTLDFSHPFIFSAAFSLPRLEALILSYCMSSLGPAPVRTKERWILPSLKTIVVDGVLQDRYFNEKAFRAFITQFASSLTSLLFTPGCVDGSGSQAVKWIWNDLPRLQKLEATANSLLGLSRPPNNHPPITLILGDLHDSYSWFKLEKTTQLCNKLQTEWKSWPIDSVVIPCSWDDLRRTVFGIRRHFGINSVIQIPSGLDILSRTGVPLLDCFGSSASSGEGQRCLKSLRNIRNYG